jgi:hypothetical protein
MGRPKQYANAAERQAAFRARYPTLTVRTKPETKETITRLMEALDLSESEIVNQLLQFALANRVWLTSPRFTSLLPRKENPIEGEDEYA